MPTNTDLTQVTFRMTGAELKAHAANGRTKIGRAAKAEITRRSAKRSPVAPAPVVETVEVRTHKGDRKAATALAQAWAEDQPGGFSLRAMLAKRSEILRAWNVPSAKAEKAAAK